MKNLIGKLTGWAIWGLILLLTLNLIKDIGRTRSIREQIEAEEQKLTKIEADNKKLQDQLAQAQSADFIEKEVRDKLGLAKEGEAIVVLPDPETIKKLAPQIEHDSDTLPDPNWRKWLKLFI
jgi:cell division protein FtsB